MQSSYVVHILFFLVTVRLISQLTDHCARRKRDGTTSSTGAGWWRREWEPSTKRDSLACMSCAATLIHLFLHINGHSVNVPRYLQCRWRIYRRAEQRRGEQAAGHTGVRFLLFHHMDRPEHRQNHRHHVQWDSIRWRLLRVQSHVQDVEADQCWTTNVCTRHPSPLPRIAIIFWTVGCFCPWKCILYF